MIDCVNVRYQQGEGEQKALRTDETIEITMRTGFRASKVRQYFKTERGERDSWSEQLYDGLSVGVMC